MTSDAKLHPDCPAGPECPPDDPTIHDLWHEGNLEECEKGLRSMLAKCPSCPDNNVQLIGCIASQGRHEEADALIEESLPRAYNEEQLSWLCAHKGSVLMECFGAREAIPWYTLAADLGNRPGTFANLAAAMWRAGRKKAAATLAEKALAKLPFDPGAIRITVTLLIKADRGERARGPLRALASREYEVADYHAAVAEGLILVGLQRKGLAVARRAAKEHPESLAVACIGSRLLLDAGKRKAAAQLLRRLLKLDPAGHGKLAIMNLSLVAAEDGDTERMLRWAVRANVEFNDAATRRLLKRTSKIVTLQVREREAALKKLAAEHARVTSKHEALEEALAGYDLSEGGTNLEFALRDGEGWHIEFKECMPHQARDLAIEVAALSSQGGGGTIFLGVRDNGDILGIGGVETLKDRDQWRHRIAQIATKVVQPPNPVTVYFNERDGLGLIKIWVPEGSAPVYYVDHIAYIRNLDESRKATPEEITDYIARRSATGGRNGH